MTGFGLMLLLVAIASIYALGLVGYRLLLSARRLNTELTKSKELIEDLNSFEKTMPIGAEASNGADLLSLLGQRRRIRQAKEQRVKARRRRLLQRINNIEIDKRIGMRLQGWEWIIILAIVLLLWGAPKLPALAKKRSAID